jgi:hypothetical protein
MTIFNTLLSGMAATFILTNLALLVAAVVWAMGGLSWLTRERKFTPAPTASRQRKPALHV